MHAVAVAVAIAIVVNCRCRVVVVVFVVVDVVAVGWLQDLLGTEAEVKYAEQQQQRQQQEQQQHADVCPIDENLRYINGSSDIIG